MKFQFYIFILHFFFENILIKCKNEIMKNNLDNSPLLLQNDLKLSQPKILLKYNNIQEEFITLKVSKYIELNADTLKYIDTLLIHVFSINCQIQVQANISDNLISIENIYNNNDKYLIKIKKKEKTTNELLSIRINLTLIQNNNNFIGAYPLVINSMNMTNKQYNLSVEEHNQTIFYFNDNLKSINLNYILNKYNKYKGDDSYFVFSFLFNEKASFEINIDADIKFNKIRTISNSHNIFLTKDSFEKDLHSIDNLTINVKRIGEDNKPVLMTFTVISNKTDSLILQKKYLNQGFITSKVNQTKYSMEIMKNEEGEIMLHDKRQNGKLFGKICKKNDIDCYNNNNQPVIEYKEHMRKIKFNYRDTQECDEGCDLLIFYIHNTLDNINTIIGFEFTLLARVWNKDDWSQTNIVNIPNNEYIFGCFEKNLINQHYYSILLNNETELIVEIKGKNFRFFYGEGNRKLNTYNELLDNTNELEIQNEMEMKNISYSNNNGEYYLSFAVRPKNFFEDIASFYYFRIFQTENISHLIMPLDSNIENNCKILNPNSDLRCVYLLKNDYNEFYLDFSITHSSIFHNYLSETYIYTSEKDVSLNIEEETSFDFYSPDENYKKEKGLYIINNITNTNLNYILFIFSLYFQEEESYLSFFHNIEKDIYPQIYSNQIYKIESNNSFIFSSLSNYYLNLNWINGTGKINNFKSIDFDLDRNDKGKIYSTIFPDDNEYNITIENKEDLLVNLGLKYTTKKDIIREIKDGELFNEMIQDTYFPIYFYYKLFDKTISYDINFRIINYNNILAEYSIEGMFCKYETIKRIEEDEYINFNVDLNAQYDSSLDIGLLEISEDRTCQDNDYILIKIDQKNERCDANILIQIISLSKFFGSFYSYFPINQFILGSKYDNNTLDNLYFDILHENNTGEKMIIEFNKNNPGIELIYDNDNENEVKLEKIEKGGVEKFIISNISPENGFWITYNDSKAPKNLKSSNYLIRYYYLTERFKDVEYVFPGQCNITGTKQLNESFAYISLSFDNLNITNVYNSDGTVFNNNSINISYTIYLNLFLDEDIKEILNSTAIILTKPVSKEVVITSNEYPSFDVNMIVNITNVSNFNYIMQIKFYLNNSLVNDKMLAFSKNIDLNDYLKAPKKKKDNKDKKLVIGLSTTISILVIIIIIIFIGNQKMKKKNKELKDKVLSISFAQGKSDNILTTDPIHSKKDEEYESIFI